MYKKLLTIVVAMVLLTTINLNQYVMAENQEENTDKPRPKVIRTVPNAGERYFDPEILYKRFSLDDKDKFEEGYYLRATFDDIDSSLELKTRRPNGITLYIEGDSENQIDNTRELKFEKNIQNEFSLYIPLKEKLKDNQKYIAFIPETTFLDYPDENGEGNMEYSWSFSTNYLPKIEHLYEGTVPEFYDSNYPIIMEGSLFHRDTKVRFRDARGRSYSPNNVRILDGNTLEIYLPRSPRLPLGIYDIIISNGTNYQVELLYGVFSVVNEGQYIPNEEFKAKDSSYGMVKKLTNQSKDILEINSRNINNRYLELDLDEITASNTWTRSIKYETSSGENLTLNLKSNWTNIFIEGLRQDNYSSDNEIELIIGRAEPNVGDNLKRKLINYAIKSDLIEVSGFNLTFNNMGIKIPYFDSDGNGLKILRYDETTREFEEIPFIIDLIDRKVTGYTSKPGIFAIVE